MKAPDGAAFAADAQVDLVELVHEHSDRSDLVIMGFSPERLSEKDGTPFDKFPKLGQVPEAW